jgi:SAM-dependent methyltransferase
MCNPYIIRFGQSHLARHEVEKKDILEVGAVDINGSLRPFIEQQGPASYRGVDLVMGPCVDEICNICDLSTRYGKERFDAVICTEVIEHVRDWRNAVSNLKNVLRPDGVLLLSTRSIGFPYHGYPFDFWRFEVEDMQAIFSDMSIQANQKDPKEPGVLVKVVKGKAFVENRLGNHELYSMIKNRRCRDVSGFDICRFRTCNWRNGLRPFLSHISPPSVRKAIRKVVPRRAENC